MRRRGTPELLVGIELGMKLVGWAGAIWFSVSFILTLPTV